MIATKAYKCHIYKHKFHSITNDDDDDVTFTRKCKRKCKCQISAAFLANLFFSFFFFSLCTWLSVCVRQQYNCYYNFSFATRF